MQRCREAMRAEMEPGDVLIDASDLTVRYQLPRQYHANSSDALQFDVRCIQAEIWKMGASRVVYLRGRRFRSFHGRRDALCARACSVAHRLDRMAPRCVAFLNLLIWRSIGVSHRTVLILYGGPLYETDLRVRHEQPDSKPRMECRLFTGHT
jgi:hypothetical protein